MSEYGDPVTFSSYQVVRETWLSRRPSPLGALSAAVVTFLLVIGSFVYLNEASDGSSWMAASREAIFNQHQYWRAWTTLFAHADVRHLLANSFLFFILGTFLAGYFGIVAFPLMALFFGGVTNLIVLWSYPPATQLIGASGMVFWMGGAWLVLYFLIETRRSLVSRALRATGVGLALFMPSEAFDPSISYQCHFVGFLLGLLGGLVFYLVKRRDFRKAEVIETVTE